MIRTIIEENEVTPTGLFLEAFAVEFDGNATYPLVLAERLFDYDEDAFIGYVKDIRRIGSKLIGKFTFKEGFEAYADESLYRGSFYGDRIESRNGDGQTHVTFARLRAVSLIPIPVLTT